jgi:general secretion pathway protein E
MKPRDVGEVVAIPDAPRFGPEAIAQARVRASARASSLVAVLEELAAEPPEVFVLRLGATFAYPVAVNADLHRWQPAFDLLPFAEALRAQAILFRDHAGALRLVFGDPFDASRNAWGDERIREDFVWTLAHHADIAAWLTRQEESLYAMESVSRRPPPAAAASPSRTSRSSRSRGREPVVKLVNSTLTTR